MKRFDTRFWARTKGPALTGTNGSSAPFVHAFQSCSHRFYVLILLASVLSPLPTSAATFTIDGFVKNFFVVQDPARIDVAETVLGHPLEIDGSETIGNNVRARLNFAADVTGWLAVDASYNFVPRMQDDDAAALNALLYRDNPSTYRIDDLRPSLWPRSPDADDNFLVLQNLDRLLVTLRASKFDVFIGRQAVAWGSARSINPTDVIAPFLFTEIDTEDRIGVDAARVRVPVGALGEVDAGYVAGKDAEWDNSAAYVRAKGYAFNTDVAVIAMVFRDDNVMIGGDVTRAIWEAGFWCEGAVVIYEDENDRIIGADDVAYTRITTGVDYSLRNATYLFLEYHYNSAGRDDAGEYARNATSKPYTEGAVYLLGRHYLIPGVTWPATPLLGVGGSLLVNLNDGSLLAAPLAEYNLLDNFYLSAGAFVGFGDGPRVTSVPPDVSVLQSGFVDVPFLELESEFGAYPDTYFISARYYF